MSYNRRQFISFIGKASLGVAIIPPFVIGCGNSPNPTPDFSNTPDNILNKLKAFVTTLKCYSESLKNIVFF